jgi:hypothetical protein
VKKKTTKSTQEKKTNPKMTLKHRKSGKKKEKEGN